MALVRAACARSAAASRSKLSPAATCQWPSRSSPQGSATSRPSKRHSSQRSSTWAQWLSSSAGVQPDGTRLRLSSPAGRAPILLTSRERKKSRYSKSTSPRDAAGRLGSGKGTVTRQACRTSRFGDAEAGVDVQGCPPVLLPGLMLAGCVAGAGQAVLGAGLLVAVTGPAGQRERGVVAGQCLARLAGRQQRFPGAVECLGFPAPVADLPVERQRFLLVAGRLIMMAEPVADVAEPHQGTCLLAFAAGPLGERQRAVVEGAGPVMLAGGT